MCMYVCVCVLCTVYCVLCTVYYILYIFIYICTYGVKLHTRIFMCVCVSNYIYIYIRDKRQIYIYIYIYIYKRERERGGIFYKFETHKLVINSLVRDHRYLCLRPDGE